MDHNESITTEENQCSIFADIARFGDFPDEGLNEEYQLKMAHSAGQSYFRLRKYTEALEFYDRALNIKRNCLPDNQVHITKTLNSMESVSLMNKDVERAFIYYQLSLEMCHACLPADHPDIANVLNNIGDYIFHKHQYGQVLQHYQMALSMKGNCFPFDHPSRATTLNNISAVFSFKDKKEKTLKIREKILLCDHLDLATSFSSAGHKYEAMNDKQIALKYFKIAWTIRAKVLSVDDPAQKRTERHVIRTKRKLM